MHVSSGRYRKYIVELFQSTLLRFRDPEKDHYKCDDGDACVESECSL